MKKLKVPIYGDTITISQDWEALCKLAPSLAEEFPVAPHGAVIHSDSGLYLFLEKGHTISTLAHECLHLGYAILDHRGVEVCPRNHEALAYLVGWLTEHVNQKVQ